MRMDSGTISEFKNPHAAPPVVSPVDPLMGASFYLSHPFNRAADFSTCFHGVIASLSYSLYFNMIADEVDHAVLGMGPDEEILRREVPILSHQEFDASDSRGFERLKNRLADRGFSVFLQADTNEASRSAGHEIAKKIDWFLNGASPDGHKPVHMIISRNP